MREKGSWKIGLKMGKVEADGERKLLQVNRWL
jgi:hypothetical protein